MLLKSMIKRLESAGYRVTKPMSKAEAGSLGGRVSSPAKRLAATRANEARWQKAKAAPENPSDAVPTPEDVATAGVSA
jgi:hypothetical protein